MSVGKDNNGVIGSFEAARTLSMSPLIANADVEDPVLFRKNVSVKPRENIHEIVSDECTKATKRAIISE